MISKRNHHIKIGITPESKKSNQIKNTFGIVLKKVVGGEGNVDYNL